MFEKEKFGVIFPKTVGVFRKITQKISFINHIGELTDSKSLEVFRAHNF